MSKVSDKLLALIFSDISLGLVLPCIIGVVILAFPTVIYDFLATIHIYFPKFIWQGTMIPLQHIGTIGVMEGILTCTVPVVLGLTWNRWAGGASGFLSSVLFVLGIAAYYSNIPGAFIPTLDWLGVIVSGMLAGYIAGSLMASLRTRGHTGFKSMLIASFVAATVATIFTTQTYVWFADMFWMGVEPRGTMTYWDALGLAWFTYIAIYFVWALIAAIAAKVASWFM